MSDENVNKPKALILETRKNVRDYVEKILTLAGWQTVGIEDSKEIPSILKKDLSDPFVLFICHYEPSINQDQDLLKKVKIISPLTQRLILIPETHTHDLSKLVNQIGIRACITVPFTPKILVQHIRSCLAYFSKISKRARMQRIIVHQNRELYRAATKMKEKEKKVNQLIQEKNFEKEVMERMDESGQGSLYERFIYHGLPIKFEVISAERSGLENEIVTLFEKVAREMKLPVPKETDPENFPEEFRDPKVSGAAAKIVQMIFGSVPSFYQAAEKKENAGKMLPDMPEEESPLDPFFHVRISRDRLMAFIEKSEQIPSMTEEINLSQLIDFLKLKGIIHGVVSDQVLDKWLKTAKPNEPLQVAQGNPSFTGKDGKVIYHFENMTVQAGEIQPDGSINYKERSNIPHVSVDALLAEKVPSVQGTEGISVNGTPIPVPEVIDPGFGVKANAYLSEDGLSIFSSIDGQPHVDRLGNISVNPEISINGDVGYETGNIDFDGNVVVKGIIQEGFSVQCVNLTTEGIQAADVFIRGDLTVAGGITESQVRAMGDVQAKFINRSFVSTFADVTVQKEILDSHILLFGFCNNSTGHIIASKVFARGGIDAGSIGTDTSGACEIHVGGNELARIRKLALTNQMVKVQKQYQSVSKTIDEVKLKDEQLYPVIIKKTYLQESALDLLTDVKNKIRTTSDTDAVFDLEKEIQKLESKRDLLEKELDQLFSLQDGYVRHIENLQESYEKLKGEEQNLTIQLQEIGELEKICPAVPELVVKNTITRKTLVKGVSSSIILDKEYSGCRIQEAKTRDARSGIVDFYMIINNL